MASVLGIDVGGSGIKGAVVDTETGELESDRERIATPQPSTPERVAEVVAEIAGRFDSHGPIGVSFPTVVIRGRSTTAGNIDQSWRGVQTDALLADATGRPVTVLNDADAAGVAEMRLGAGRGLSGMVVMITIGTGLGSGVFYDGVLVPNIELGRILGKDGRPIEYYAGDRARKAEELDWPEWGKRFDFFLRHVVRTHSPDHFILGGGACKHFDRFRESLSVETPIVVARFRNNAGIVGAALAAAEH